jgi:REP element-mobilizing transposase RayT
MSPRTNNNSRTPQRGVPTRAVRKRLPHEVPLWLHPSREDYFITICCQQRGHNQLAKPPLAAALIDTIHHRNERQIWYVHLGVVMPDHVHLVVSFGGIDKPMQTIVSKWKEWTAKSLGIHWQRDFFEHRLRKEEGFREKADYVLANPVRAGLVDRPEDWPYTFIADPW